MRPQDSNPPTSTSIMPANPGHQQWQTMTLKKNKPKKPLTLCRRDTVGGPRHCWRGMIVVTVPSWRHIWGGNTALPRHNKRSWWRMRRFVEIVVAETNLYLFFATQSPPGKSSPSSMLRRCQPPKPLSRSMCACWVLHYNGSSLFTLMHTPTPLIPAQCTANK